MNLLQRAVVDVDHHQISEDFVKSLREIPHVGVLRLETLNIVESETIANMLTHYGSNSRIIRGLNAKFIADCAIIKIIDDPPLAIRRVLAVDRECEGDFDEVEKN